MAGARKKVLWVDDEIEFLRSHIMFLETRGYSVTPVFGGDDALQVLRERPHGFDIVLLDEQMPGKDGLTTLEEIKDFLPDLPVVMVTKSEEEQVMEDALGKKIDGYLTKPVNPSQILSVCKRLLDSRQILSTQITQRFLRNYSENKAHLSQPMKAQDWAKLYDTLTRWDIELETIEDEGLRQTHAGQKSDCNLEFSHFIENNYGHWLRGNHEPPVLSPNVVEKYLAPRLKEGKRVYFVVLDCMRHDQYIALEALLRNYFDIDRQFYYSIMPSSTLFARSALFAGKMPLEISEEYPGLYSNIEESEATESDTYENEMLMKKLASLGIDLENESSFTKITTSIESMNFLGNIAAYEKKQFGTIVVNFVDLLAQKRASSSILQEIAPDESAFRALTQSWFQYSNIFQILKEFSRHDCTVILTTDHGSVFCTRGTEIYGCQNLPAHHRYKVGTDITCDERHALYLSDPKVLQLPVPRDDSVYIISKENYYFIHPEKFEHYQKQYQNSFLHGGISMEEMIIPLGILSPK